MGSMTKALCAIAVTLLVVTLAFPTQAQEGPNSEESSRIRESITVLNEIMATSDTSIPTSIAAKAEGIAIFPGTIKGGFIFGGMRGRGILSARTEGGWSAPTFMTLTGGSVGLQIGGQAADLVMIIMNRRGLEQFVRINSSLAPMLPSPRDRSGVTRRPTRICSCARRFSATHDREDSLRV